MVLLPRTVSILCIILAFAPGMLATESVHRVDFSTKSIRARNICTKSQPTTSHSIDNHPTESHYTGSHHTESVRVKDLVSEPHFTTSHRVRCRVKYGSTPVSSLKTTSRTTIGISSWVTITETATKFAVYEPVKHKTVVCISSFKYKIC